MRLLRSDDREAIGRLCQRLKDVEVLTEKDFGGDPPKQIDEEVIQSIYNLRKHVEAILYDLPEK